MKKAKSFKKKTNTRLNRTIGLGDAINKSIDPILKKRGFANRDLIANWPVFAPAPYNKVAIPDRLIWSRKNNASQNNTSQEGEQGATLFLRCAPTHALALNHESAKIAAAINRYFGYVLINKIKLSLEPFSPSSSKKPNKEKTISKEISNAVNKEVSNVKDDELKQALRELGLKIKNQTE